MKTSPRLQQVAALLTLLALALTAALSVTSCTQQEPRPPGGRTGTTGAETGAAAGETDGPQGDKITVVWYGQSMFKLATQDETLLTDPFGRELGYPVPSVTADAVTISHEHFDHNNTAAVAGKPVIVRGNGPRQAAGIEFVGIPSFHDQVKGRLRGGNTIFRFKLRKVTFAHLGDLGQKSLTPAQVTALRGADVLLIPIGGGNTLDSATAAKVVGQVGPKIVIPMHYGTSVVGAGMAPVDTFTKLYPDRVKMLPATTEIDPAKLPTDTEVWVLQYGK